MNKLFVLAVLAGFITFGCTSSKGTAASTGDGPLPNPAGSPEAPADNAGPAAAAVNNAGEKGAPQDDSNGGYSLFEGVQLRLDFLKNQPGPSWYPDTSRFWHIDPIDPTKNIPLVLSAEVRMHDWILRFVPFVFGGFNAFGGKLALDDKNIEPVKIFMAAYLKLVEDDPSNFIAHNDLGMLYSIQRDWKEALEHFTRAVELNKSYFPAYYNRGMAHAILCLYEAAIEDFSRAIEIRPDIPEFYYVRGQVYFLRQMYNEARRDFIMAGRLKPDFEDISIVLQEMEKY
jgi:tetratricopeptide (TPR) repeat protein